MPRWLNCRINGQLKESDLSATNAAALVKLRRVLTQHELRGEHVRQKEDESRAGRAYWEALDRSEHVVATYWLSDDDEGGGRKA